MTIDRVATAARTSACRPGSMDELMVFAVRSGAIASPTAPVDRRVKTDKRSPKSVPLSVSSLSPRSDHRSTPDRPSGNPDVIAGLFLLERFAHELRPTRTQWRVSDPIAEARGFPVQPFPARGPSEASCSSLPVQAGLRRIMLSACAQPCGRTAWRPLAVCPSRGVFRPSCFVL